VIATGRKLVIGNLDEGARTEDTEVLGVWMMTSSLARRTGYRRVATRSRKSVPSVRDFPSLLFFVGENLRANSLPPFFSFTKFEVTDIEAINSPDQTLPSSTPSESLRRDERCPVCGGDNQCRMAKGHLYKGPCWCDEIIVPGHILRALAATHFEPACLCRGCLETAARLSLELNDSAAVAEQIRAVLLTSPPALKEEDYYLDENGNVVFTAAYHRNRGTCCGNGCRHCPY
jgi:Family of unknown function (DUF5522)/Cysteine-rich CWC